MALIKLPSMNNLSKRLSVFSFLFLFSQLVFAEWISEEQNAMGTRISVSVWSEKNNQAQKAIAEVMAEMQRIDQQFSPYIDTSELSRLNRLAAKNPQKISDEMLLLLDSALKVGELTNGAFDITFASVGHLYNYREQEKPSDKEITIKQAAIDYRKILIQNKTVSFSHPDVVIDLGGIAKGYAADRAIEIFKRHGIEHGSFSAGGDSRLLGDRKGRPWLVGIENPRQPDAIAITLPLANVAVSTSGDYERFFIDKETGERVHHIINPRSGKSVKGVTSVTILGETGLQTDPLSTSVFVLGVEKGLALINQIEDVDAIIIDSKGKVHYSLGLSSGS
jgi:thiamine biosynthesis lipoprotein